MHDTILRYLTTIKDKDAGPLLCGGIRGYIVCRRSQVRADQWIVLMGAAGDLGHDYTNFQGNGHADHRDKPGTGGGEEKMVNVPWI